VGRAARGAPSDAALAAVGAFIGIATGAAAGARTSTVAGAETSVLEAGGSLTTTDPERTGTLADRS
jgi:hypothetical protein